MREPSMDPSQPLTALIHTSVSELDIEDCDGFAEAKRLLSK